MLSVARLGNAILAVGAELEVLLPAGAKASGVGPHFIVAAQVCSRREAGRYALPSGDSHAAVADGHPVFEVAVGDFNRRLGNDGRNKRSGGQRRRCYLKEMT